MNYRRLSKFSHIYTKNDRTMIYHSLKMVSEDITGATYDEMTNSLTNIDPSMEKILTDNGWLQKRNFRTIYLNRIFFSNKKLQSCM